jgi:hypothetical protein
VPALVEPVPRPLLQELRLVVARLRRAQPRRSFAPGVHVGTAADQCVSFIPRDTDAMDDGLRGDVVTSLLLRSRTGTPTVSPGDTAPLVWLSRPGSPQWHDFESAWLGPAVRAYAEADLSLTLVVVTKGGWVDPRSGVGRSWVRLRLR